MNIGVINLSIKFEESYSEILEKNDINVVQLTADNFEERESECDGMIICEDAVQDTACTCSILLKLKEKPNVYVWVMSSNLQKIMRSVYLQLGALGIIPEDLEPNELQLFISNNLNKCKKAFFYEGKHLKKLEPEEEVMSGTKSLELIPRNHSVKINGKKEIPLTRLEYKTMEILYKNKNNTVIYKELFELIWDKEFNNQNYRVANLIFHLREKIESDAVDPMIIRTVRSKGYMLCLKEYDREIGREIHN
ncbi:response regulator transcription factor [Enterococcus sp. BWB1-3]|nr:winged helix-turn-helix domain-containing protein [Enterococcus sp. CWB-B31]MBL1229332.1 response regulator transcription factor [Enterococcus sp. BWB1-3]MCB5956127.1 winged helix-turn-helix domain-containing protein [Enterococcus sp. CWB-B31]